MLEKVSDSRDNNTRVARDPAANAPGRSLGVQSGAIRCAVCDWGSLVDMADSGRYSVHDLTLTGDPRPWSRDGTPLKLSERSGGV